MSCERALIGDRVGGVSQILQGSKRTWRTRDGVERTSSLDSPIVLFTGHGGAVFTLKFYPQETVIASGSHDKETFLWNAQGDCDNFMVLKGQQNAVLDLHWNILWLANCLHDHSPDTYVSEKDTEESTHRSIDRQAVFSRIYTEMITPKAHKYRMRMPKISNCSPSQKSSSSPSNFLLIHISSPFELSTGTEGGADSTASATPPVLSFSPSSNTLPASSSLCCCYIPPRKHLCLKVRDGCLPQYNYFCFSTCCKNQSQPWHGITERAELQNKILHPLL